MARSLDLKTRHLLALYRTELRGKSLDMLARNARASGRTFVRLRNVVPSFERTAA